MSKESKDIKEEKAEAKVSERLVRLLCERQIRTLKGELDKLHSADISEILSDTPTEYRLPLFRLLPKKEAAEVFSDMDSDLQREIIDGVRDGELAEILEYLFLDDTVDMIEEMPAGVVKRIIRNSTEENRKTINKLLKYGKDSAGGLMTTEYVRLLSDITVGEALQHIRKAAKDVEEIYPFYVTDGERRLIGAVTLKDILLTQDHG